MLQTTNNHNQGYKIVPGQSCTREVAMSKVPNEITKKELSLPYMDSVKVRPPRMIG